MHTCTRGADDSTEQQATKKDKKQADDNTDRALAQQNNRKESDHTHPERQNLARPTSTRSHNAIIDPHHHTRFKSEHGLRVQGFMVKPCTYSSAARQPRRCW